MYLLFIVFQVKGLIEFDSFLSTFDNFLNDINKRKPSVFVITGYFNSRSFSWWSKDINAIEGLKLFSLTSSNGLSQFINEPNHIQTNSTSCMDLIFTDQKDLSVNSGVYWSLHPHYHHQIDTLVLVLIFTTPIVSTISIRLQKV